MKKKFQLCLLKDAGDRNPIRRISQQLRISTASQSTVTREYRLPYVMTSGCYLSIRLLLLSVLKSPDSNAASKDLLNTLIQLANLHLIATNLLHRAGDQGLDTILDVVQHGVHDVVRLGFGQLFLKVAVLGRELWLNS